MIQLPWFQEMQSCEPSGSLEGRLVRGFTAYEEAIAAKEQKWELMHMMLIGGPSRGIGDTEL